LPDARIRHVGDRDVDSTAIQVGTERNPLERPDCPASLGPEAEPICCRESAALVYCVEIGARRQIRVELHADQPRVGQRQHAVQGRLPVATSRSHLERDVAVVGARRVVKLCSGSDLEVDPLVGRVAADQVDRRPDDRARLELGVDHHPTTRPLQHRFESLRAVREMVQAAAGERLGGVRGEGAATGRGPVEGGVVEQERYAVPESCRSVSTMSAPSCRAASKRSIVSRVREPVPAAVRADVKTDEPIEQARLRGVRPRAERGRDRQTQK
jgi:hypothetical protein